MRVEVFHEEIEPFCVFCRTRDKARALLESNLFHERYGRYSFVFFEPKDIFVCGEGDNPVEYLEELSKVISKAKEDSPLVFNGGLVGYLSYDFGEELMGIEREDGETALPKAFFGYFEDFLIVDRLKKQTVLVSSFSWLEKELSSLLRSGCSNCEFDEPVVSEWWGEFEKEEYMQAVAKVKRYIEEGDVYQVNLSQRFHARGSIDPLGLYRILRKANYGSYHAFFSLRDASVVSTSPELFLRKRGDTIVTRPIKGTVRRGRDEVEDERLKEKLFNDVKCRSELLMIVDLERNDLAKICVPESIEVEKLYEVEEYSSVFHLVSTVKGQLREGVSFKDIVLATFPGGSITGAPKLSAMKVIAELEKSRRGVYCGSIGYVSRNQNMEFNIAIRTAVWEKGSVYFNVGGGIVWDSDEEEEWWETIHKGKPFFEALGVMEFAGTK